MFIIELPNKDRFQFNFIWADFSHMFWEIGQQLDVLYMTWAVVY